MSDRMKPRKMPKRQKVFNVDEVRLLLKAIHDSGKTTQDLEQFMRARHAPERNAEMEKCNPNQATIDSEKARIKSDLKAIDIKTGAAMAAEMSVNALNQAKSKIAHECKIKSGA